MADVDDIIDYIRCLRRGFDKDLFQSKVDELAYAVDTTGLNYEDFHSLFKIWLNLSIPIQNWKNLGCCLVPSTPVEERTVTYSILWILTNCSDPTNYSRVSFVLDWLTAAMESNFIDLTALDIGYEAFYSMLSNDILTVYVMKLVYTLTKPADVSRQKVLELIECAKRREGKQSLYKQLQVLLGLFKSYKPQYVPEDVPAISIHTAFKKINPILLARYKKVQEQRNTLNNEKQYLSWMNPFTMNRGKNKKADPLVPLIECLSFNQQSDKAVLKSLLDFSDMPSLLSYSVRGGGAAVRPARLRALLCNEAGLTLLAVAAHKDHAFLSYDLHHILVQCFFASSPNSISERCGLLARLAQLQRAVAQGIGVLTRFLAQYLPFWNERDYFAQILELAEWVSVDSPENIESITEAIGKVFLRAHPMERCAILKSLTYMYTNLVYSSTKRRQHFLNRMPSQDNYTIILPKLADKLSELCSKALQIDPDDMRVVHMSAWSAERCARAELACKAQLGALPRALPLALPLLAFSPRLLDNMAELIILYKKILTISKSRNDSHFATLNAYLLDLINCLFNEQALSARRDGLVFSKLHPQLEARLVSVVPDADAKFSIRNHLAFAIYSFMMSGENHVHTDNKMFFYNVIQPEYPNLGRFLRKSVPELRQS